MLRFIIGKILWLIPTLIGITIVAFGFVRVLPGDPVLLMAGERGLSPERHAELAHQLGFDRHAVAVALQSSVWLNTVRYRCTNSRK